MKRLRQHGFTVAFILCIVLCSLSLLAQQSASISMQMSTQERLESESWWPTMSNLPLDAFVGSAACVHCHQDEASSRPTSMQRAAKPAADETFLKGKPPQVYTTKPFTYTLDTIPAGLEYTVSDGPHKLSRKLDWIIGDGVLARTFLYQMDGHWYQSLASFYTEPAALDITTGLNRGASQELASALGTPLSTDDTIKCFGCHTVHATTSQGFNPLHAEAGLGCEACHGPGRSHASQMSTAAKSPPSAGHISAATSTIFNPAKLSPTDSNDFCGACHRSFADATLSTAQVHATSTAVVRFQPYRIEESRCWRDTQDARLTCLGCHNPHEPLNRDAAFYNKRCLQCHAAAPSATAAAPPLAHAASVCPKATSQCISCHMPKVHIASMHADFTDHYIRIAHPGEAVPQ